MKLILTVRERDIYTYYVCVCVCVFVDLQTCIYFKFEFLHLDLKDNTTTTRHIFQMCLLPPLFQLTLQDSGSLRGGVNEIWSPKRTGKKKDEIKLKHFRLLKARDTLLHLNLPYVCLTRKSTVLFVSTAIYSPLVDLGVTEKWGF